MSDADRLPCATTGCPNRILPATAARTGGICRPCEQRIAYEQHQEFVRANRREVDPFDGVTDPAEVMRILVRPKRHDELVIEKPFSPDVGDYIRDLGAGDVERLIALAVSYLDEHEDEAETVARCLAAFTNASLDTLQQAWVDAGRYYPTIVFRGASNAIFRRVREAAESDPASRNHALQALAWIGSAEVVELFASWRDRPPRWQDELYVPPFDYSYEAAWELDEHGRRRDLFLPLAHALLPADANGDSGVEAEHCPWCTSPLETLLRPERDGLPARIATCPRCGCYGPIFMQLDASGRPHWHRGNEKPRYGPFEPQAPFDIAGRVAIGAQRGALHAADPSLPTSLSQLGGAPGWIQDADFPRCPDCTRTMVFVSQLVPGEWDDSLEGCFYAFWCAACRVTATVYQQT